MPTFDFLCSDCGHVFEFTRPFGSKVDPACPACKSRSTEKQITPPTIQFKGEGFYKTDSAQKKRTGKKDSKESNSSSSHQESGQAPLKTGELKETKEAKASEPPKTTNTSKES